MQPLVSVMICIHNSTSTVGWALASLMAQTYENWEAIIVDDGSTDHPEYIIEQIRDERIKLFRLPVNVGRGAARQFALGQTQGKYLAVLDGDDWLYPSKIEAQVEVMENDQSIIFSSTPLAVVNSENQLTGIRYANANCGQIVTGNAGPNWIKVPFCSSMMRSLEAKKIGFDETLRRSEDFDFLMKLLWGKRLYVLKNPLHAYRYESGVTGNTSWQAARETLKCNRQAIKKHMKQFPVLSRFMVLQCYKLLLRTSLRRLLGIMESPDPLPNDDQKNEFEQARATIASFEARFDASSSALRVS